MSIVEAVVMGGAGLIVGVVILGLMAFFLLIVDGAFRR